MNDKKYEIKKVEVPQDVVTYIESLNYEKTARETIITRMLEMQSKYGTKETEAFNKYHEEYLEHATSFELAKQEIENKYFPKEWKGHNVYWNLDYSTRVIIFEKRCDC